MRSYLLCLLSGILLFPHLSAYAQTHDMAHHHAMPAQVYQSQGSIKKNHPAGDLYRPSGYSRAALAADDHAVYGYAGASAGAGEGGR